MRSVKVERKARGNPRTNAARGSARAPRSGRHAAGQRCTRGRGQRHSGIAQELASLHGRFPVVADGPVCRKALPLPTAKSGDAAAPAGHGDDRVAAR